MTSGGNYLAAGPAASGPAWSRPAASGPVGTDADGMRVGDAERAAVADRLAWHFSHGRLGQAELDDRLDRVMRAKTRADLAGLLTDLPEADQPTGRVAQASRRQQRRQRRAELELQRRRLRTELRDGRRTARAHRARGLTWVLVVAGVIVTTAWVAHALTHSVAAWIVVLVIAVLWLRRGRIRD